MVYSQSNLLPEVEFVTSSNGITVYSTRFSTPRFLPFDNPGKCLNCRSEGVEVDFIVMSQGILIYCSRIKCPRFLPFDCIYALPNHCFFKLRTKGRVINIPYENMKPSGKLSLKEEGTPQQFFDSLSTATTFLDHQIPSQNKTEGNAEQFINSLSAATHLLPTQEKIEPMPSSEEFLDSLSAATTFLNQSNPKINVPTNPEGNGEQFFDSLSAATHLLPTGQSLPAEAGLEQFFDSLSAATSILRQPLVNKPTGNMQPNDKDTSQDFIDSINAATKMLEQPPQQPKKQTQMTKRRR